MFEKKLTRREFTKFGTTALLGLGATLCSGSKLFAIDEESGQKMLEARFYRNMNAVTVDLKAFTDTFYRKVCFSRLDPVLKTLINIRSAGKHLEIVNLMIPTLNDDPNDVRKMCRWILKHLGEDTPVHFSRFHPNYKLLNLPPRLSKK
jgi:pyruvate-formate lyase-activating enzyme